MQRSDSGRLRRLALLSVALGGCAAACQSDVRSEPALSSSTLTSAAERVRIGQVSWYVDYDAAVAIARAQDQALWVHFGENPG